MARTTVTATAMVDGNATETAVAIVNGDRNCNGRRQRHWATATAMVMESATTTDMATAITMATATARMMMTKAGLPLHVLAMCSAMAGATTCLHPHGHNGKCIHQRCIMLVTLLRVCVFLASNYGWGTVIHEIPISSFPILMTSLPYPSSSVSSLSRGRVPDSSPWILFLFIIYNYCSVY